MAPNRSLKRQKISDNEHQSPATIQPAQVPLPSDKSTSNESTSTSSVQDTSDRSSWYSRTWPRKAAPIAQVARESISSASSVASEAASIIKDRARTKPARKSSLALTLGKSTSNKSLPADARTTKDHALPSATTPSKKTPAKNDLPPPEPPSVLTPTLSLPKEPESERSSADKKEELKAEAEAVTATQPYTPRSWIGWLARGEDDSKGQDATSSISLPIATADENRKVPSPPTERDQTSDPVKVAEGESLPPVANNRRSWLPIWNVTVETDSSFNVATDPKLAEPPTVADPQRIQQSKSKAASIETSLPPQLSHDTAKSSGWGFWSRDRKPNDSVVSLDQPHMGEIAISDEHSQGKPKKAALKLNDSKSKAENTPSPGRPTLDDVKVSRSERVESQILNEHKRQGSKVSATTTKAESSNAAASAVEPSEISNSRPGSPAPFKKTREHFLLPAFQDTLKIAENPSILQQLSRLIYHTKQPEVKHLSRVRDPPRIKNALAIGVHGYFPSPLVRTVLGQPTGTSLRFANMAAKAIEEWTEKRGYECQVKTAALEGEGKIAERIELLWKLLLNWIDEIRKSDFVMIACHSQGVPVAIMLVSKLIKFGCLNAARVGICAMAGVNMGPFPELKLRLWSGSAGELFEFSDPNSRVSSDYHAALEEVLKFGVRITYVGSIDDQLVSLESSIFAPISHPHIYRAVSIDSKVHAPSFLSHLVGFALKLRNLGVVDHGLIRELSTPLAGSLYGGEGHSRIYEDATIYSLAVSFALETTSLVGLPMVQRSVTSSAGNPYILPFAMRGILEEHLVKTEFQGEAAELLIQFDEWKPTTKALKDVKFRLEGIRSKL